jgi:hypothetical protein
MRDWKVERLRYLIHFSDGGSGKRHRDEPLEADAELRDGGSVYEVERVEQPPNPHSFGHAWAKRVE